MRSELYTNNNGIKFTTMQEKKHLYKIRNNTFDPNEFIKDFIDIRNERLRKYKQYTTEKNAIDNREKPDSDLIKVWNKIHNSFFNLIVDQKVGYVFGNPISYQIEEEVSENEREWVKEYLYNQDVFLKDIETGTQQAACGVSYRLLDIQTQLIPSALETVANLKNVNSWDAYVLGHKEAAIVLSEDYTDKGHTQILTLYTKDIILEYHSAASEVNGMIEFDIAGGISNLLGVVPVFEFRNNQEMHSDFETVEDLNDAYDRMISSGADEVEQFRLAYMLITGVDIEEDEAKALFKKETGILNIRNPEGKAEFLTKMMPKEFFEYFVGLLEKNIFRFSKSVDVNDEAFAGGNESGEARKWKLIALEFKSNLTESWFEKGLRDMFEGIVAYMRIKQGMNSIVSSNIYADFTRTLPVDLGYLADTLTKLTTILSERTVLGMVPTIDDVDAEMEQKQREREEKMSEMNSFGDFGQVNPNDAEQTGEVLDEEKATDNKGSGQTR
ncbi:phage portal protein [Bacillus wiedmannii]|uniref:phage portal protein n=1 Tax=Bacillus wiedmannii TaxID=1890302 RepID=UPI000BFDF9A3|nr:phage portal protein [Bacillus wiedmannii]PHF94203.1 phage portal protein [Bacillus wiedmannii]